MSDSVWPIETQLTDRGALYDRRAALYDRFVRSPLYNRLFWSTSPDDYSAFARRALADGDGPLLDVAGGSAAATAPLYAETNRPIVLSDRSRGMLEVAATRIARNGTLPAGLRLVQTDIFAHQFAPASFDTVLCMGFMHIAPDPRALLDALLALVAPRKRVYFSSLVAETFIGRRTMNVLARAGEIATPRTAKTLQALLGEVELEVKGCMAYGVATRSLR